MTTYAPVPAFVDHKRHPRALLLIVAGHAALLAAVITAKMDLPLPFVPETTEVTLVPLPPEPIHNPPHQQPHQRASVIDHPPVVLPVPKPDVPQVDTTPIPVPLPDPGAAVGALPGPSVTPVPEPVFAGPRLATPESEIRPPYPQNKLRLGEEASLRLRLSIDERGRVVAVEPVGAADSDFLAAARRHLIAHWRYKPATKDGMPVASTTVITLRFQLDE